MKTKSLGFIGGGRITRIFLQAFANKNTEFQSTTVYDNKDDVTEALKRQFPQIRIAEDIFEAASCSTVIIALHPPMIMETLEKIADAVSKQSLVISLAPKITIEKMATKLKTGNIARLIPNATSYINEGYNPVTFGPDFKESEKVSLLKLLEILGNTPEVEEAKLEAYALISAMLPTYFWFQWQEIMQLGPQMGLSEKESRNTVEQTLKAAINLMFKSDLSADQVMDLIPVKPIGEFQSQISDIYKAKLMGLFEKIKP